MRSDLPHLTRPPQQPGTSRREQLISFFLTCPAYNDLPASGKAAYRQKLRQLGQLETEELRQSTGIDRPLTWGDPVPHLQAVLAAAQQLGAGVGQPIFFAPAGGIVLSFSSLLYPRLMTWGLVSLLKAACLCAPGQPVWVRLQEQAQSLTVSVQATADFDDPAADDIAQECARIHGGTFRKSPASAVFSCARIPAPTGIRPAPTVTAEELLRDTLSPVWSGFYAFIAER